MKYWGTKGGVVRPYDPPLSTLVEVYKQTSSTSVTHNSLFREDKDLSVVANKAVKNRQWT